MFVRMPRGTFFFAQQQYPPGHCPRGIFKVFMYFYYIAVVSRFSFLLHLCAGRRRPPAVGQQQGTQIQSHTRRGPAHVVGGTFESKFKFPYPKIRRIPNNEADWPTGMTRFVHFRFLTTNRRFNSSPARRTDTLFIGTHKASAAAVPLHSCHPVGA